MKAWKESLDKVEKGTASQTEYIHAITHWLQSEIPQNTEGMYESISRRAVWVFPNNYAFAVGTNFNPVFYHLTMPISDESTLPFDDFNSEWSYARQANGWRYDGVGNSCLPPEKIAHFIEIFTTKYGVPSLVLPWHTSWTEQITDQGEEYYEDWEDEPGSLNNLREMMYKLATMATNGTLVNHSPWSTQIVDEEEALSQYSDYSKFKKLVSVIEERKIAILDLDQHCSGCGSGTYEYAIQEDPELEGKPIFRTWSQNSEWMWLGDGSIFLEVYMDDEVAEKEIKKAALELGFDFDLDENGEPEISGSISYES